MCAWILVFGAPVETAASRPALHVRVQCYKNTVVESDLVLS